MVTIDAFVLKIILRGSITTKSLQFFEVTSLLFIGVQAGYANFAM